MIGGGVPEYRCNVTNLSERTERFIQPSCEDEVYFDLLIPEFYLPFLDEMQGIDVEVACNDIELLAEVPANEMESIFVASG